MSASGPQSSASPPRRPPAPPTPPPPSPPPPPPQPTTTAKRLLRCPRCPRRKYRTARDLALHILTTHRQLHFDGMPLAPGGPPMLALASARASTSSAQSITLSSPPEHHAAATAPAAAITKTTTTCPARHQQRQHQEPPTASSARHAGGATPSSGADWIPDDRDDKDMWLPPADAGTATAPPGGGGGGGGGRAAATAAAPLTTNQHPLPRGRIAPRLPQFDSSDNTDRSSGRSGPDRRRYPESLSCGSSSPSLSSGANPYPHRLRTKNPSRTVATTMLTNHNSLALPLLSLSSSPSSSSLASASESSASPSCPSALSAPLSRTRLNNQAGSRKRAVVKVTCPRIDANAPRRQHPKLARQSIIMRKSPPVTEHILLDFSNPVLY